MAGGYRAVVIGAGPAGLSAALSVLANGGDGKVLVLERRAAHDERDRRSHGSRRRVVILDEAAVAGLRAHGIDVTPIEEMVVRLPDGRLRFFPNSGGWRLAVEAMFGDRRLAGLIAVGDLEDALLRAFRHRGGVIRYGVVPELTLNSQGRASIGVDGEVLPAAAIVVADGAGSNTAGAYVRRTVTARDGPPSWFLCLDFDAMDATLVRPGDIVSTFEPQLRVIMFGFVEERGASFNLLLPPGTEMSDAGQRRYYLALLRQFVRDLGVTGSPLDADGVTYDGPIATADPILLGRNVILVGDAARESDPIAGTGVNAALADGWAVGAALAQPGFSAQEAKELVRSIGQNTATAVRLSRLVRGRARYLFKHPNRSIAALASGLASRRLYWKASVSGDL